MSSGPRFVTAFDPSIGVLEDVAPGVRRIVAPNPGPFTFRGTGTYVIGRGDVAIIDPGPNDERHIAMLMRQLRSETVTHVLVTHTHPDHSPGCVPLRAHTTASTYGFGPHPDDPPPALATHVDPLAASPGTADETTEGANPTNAEESGDRTFVPDGELRHGDFVQGTGWRAEAVHTPGHISNHLSFRVTFAGAPNDRLLFSGDHVMGWSTSVISPPHGDLRNYVESLQLLQGAGDARYWPTHGTVITDPETLIAGLLLHRARRTAQIIDALRSGDATIDALVSALYVGLDPRLVKAAGRSVLAHLVELERRGDVARAEPGDASLSVTPVYGLVGR